MEDDIQHDSLLEGLGRHWYDCLDKFLGQAELAKHEIPMPRGTRTQYTAKGHRPEGDVLVTATHTTFSRSEVLDHYDAQCHIYKENGNCEQWDLPGQGVYSRLENRFASKSPSPDTPSPGASGNIS